MARARVTDFLQNHKFALVEIVRGVGEREAFGGRPEISSGSQVIGCQSITIPEISSEPLELNEGTEMFAHHINTGRAIVGEVVISLAVIPFASVGLYSWMHRALYGLGNPRKDFKIIHYLGGEADFAGSEGGKIYILEGCIPTSYKLTSDLSGEDDAVSLETITIQPHRIKLQLPPGLAETEDDQAGRAQIGEPPISFA